MDKCCTVKTDTLCWKCMNAVPTKDNKFGCSWSRDFEPVEGWTADKVRLGGTSSYIVYDCPEFIDEEKILIEKMDKRLLEHKPGDPIFVIMKNGSGLVILEGIIEGFSIFTVGEYAQPEIAINYKAKRKHVVLSKKIGRTVFFTREEAEDALILLKGEEV